MVLWLLISSLSGYLVRLYVAATTKTARILSMLYIPLVNAHAYFVLILKWWIKRLCSNLNLLCRPQGMEIVFTEELFEADLSVEERAKHWIALFSNFDENDRKALQYILLQKQRWLADVGQSLSSFLYLYIYGWFSILLSRMVLHIWSLPHFPGLIPWSLIRCMQIEKGE